MVRLPRPASPPCFLALLLCALLAGDTAGQTIRGRVTDRATGEPLQGVTLTSYRTERPDSAVSSTTSGRNGFVLKLRDAGEFVLEARHLGFGTLRTPPVNVLAGETVELEFALAVDAIALDPVIIQSDRAAGIAATAGLDFNFRYYSGLGTFVLREDLERMPDRRLDQILTDLGGVVIQYTGHGDPVPQMRRAPVSIGRRPNVSRRDMETPEGSFAQMAECLPNLYVDGAPWVRIHDNLVSRVPIQGVRDFFSFRSADIEAIELYRSAAQTPALFGGGDALCGVIAVWLRRG